MPDGVATWSTTFSLFDLVLEKVRADIEAIKTEIGLLDIPSDVSPEVGTLKADVAILQSHVATLRTDVATLKTDVATARSNITTLQTDVATARSNITTLQGSVTTLQSNVNNLQGNVANLFQITDALQTMPVPITFAFAGTPVQGSMVNIPLTMNLSIPNGLAGSRYYNATAPLVASVFTLTRLPANTPLATINVNTAGQGVITGSGATNLSATDTLRMTATTIGGSLANVSITIQAARR